MCSDYYCNYCDYYILAVGSYAARHKVVDSGDHYWVAFHDPSQVGVSLGVVDGRMKIPFSHALVPVKQVQLVSVSVSVGCASDVATRCKY